MKQPIRFFGGLVVGILLFASCARPSTFPALEAEDQEVYHHGSIIWRELIVHDGQQVIPFYQSVFGWTIEQSFDGDNDYYLVKKGNKPIAGIWAIGQKDAGSGGEWIPFISVENVSASADRLRIVGGSTLGETFDMKGRGKAAIVRDPQEAMFGIIRTDYGDPEPQVGIGEFVWAELWAEDPSAVSRFYSGLGYEMTAKSEGLNPYYLLQNKGERVGGAIKNPMLETRSFWVSYISVDNVEAAVERVKASGGTVYLEPTIDFREGRTAICADPSGAPFLLQQGPVSLKTTDTWNRRQAACEDC
ncbi:VOC family protein [Cryomorphaceae bacterium]|nr:VOC family protein [Cryomorphaceae bacterium]